ncbi:MAG: hypothetical protein ACK6BU_01980, partial [Cyanobacteriota bacterium]
LSRSRQILFALPLLFLALLAPLPAPAAPLPSCLGETRSLVISSGMPYTPLRVQGRTGFFVLDLGADGSAISPGTFLGRRGPQPLQGSGNTFAGVDFFGPLAPLRLNVQDHSAIRGPLPQAGLIGTDLLSNHVWTLDYANGLLSRADQASSCADGVLRQAGFQPLSSAGYFGTNVASLSCPAAPRRGPCPNIPSIPVRIGSSMAVAQVDTGYDDGLHSPSLNINRAWFNQLTRSVRLEPHPEANLTLSTCAGVSEQVLAYRLPPGKAVELVGSDGSAVRRLQGVTLFLKDTPPAARRCGGIGTWDRAAAQLGASFVNDGTLVVDPFSQRLWFRPGPAEPGAPAR